MKPGVHLRLLVLANVTGSDLVYFTRASVKRTVQAKDNPVNRTQINS